MSKAIYVCFRDPSRCNAEVERKIEIIAQRITPDNITPRPTRIVRKGNIIYGISNPTSTIEEYGNSILLGMAFGDQDQWWRPEERIPDGSFSIFRSDDQKTEVLTDVVGSRTVWYYHDDEIFIASSSQRAIIMMIGDFQFNNEVISWMLSSGALGPFLSWDRRIKMLLPDSSVILDYKSWTLNLKTNEVKFKPDSSSDEEHTTQLLEQFARTFKSLNIDFSKWVLPISGGYDSRGILNLFNFIGVNLKHLKAITWGIESAINKPGNDAFIAKQLANHYQIEHNYYLTNTSNDTIETIFERFLICGEGRIDHVSGYMDGFNLWRNLYLDNVEGIIRGDVSFSAKAASFGEEIRKLQGIYLCSDFSNLREYNSGMVYNQKVPESLLQKEEETLEMWRDRLYQQYRMPVILSALSDLKLPFVEVINPLLSKRIVSHTRSIPDRLRTDKILFKQLVESLGPDIDYAKTGANANKQVFLKSKLAVDLFKKELYSLKSKSILSETLINHMIENLRVTEEYVYKKPTAKIFLIKMLPGWLTKKAKKLNTGRVLDTNILAFRSFIISRMNQLLYEDAALFRNNNSTVLTR